ncbi:4-hydroxy-tetrahydrodipicolinate synthase [bacterium]|nr:4-hydroxy-tetrahydrodipicolinate synthase [bacterium]
MSGKIGWKGMFTALATPFKADGTLDEDGLVTLVERQLAAGIHGLVPCGTTGESPALDSDEWAKVVELTVHTAKGKAWVVAGTGTNNTAISVEKTKRARELGADGALVITPYYNKPTPDGLVLHFSRVAEGSGQFPIMVYNVPSRTGVNALPATIGRLVEIPGVAAVKEASGNLAQAWEVAARFGDKVAVLSGEDALNLPILEAGCDGAVSVLTNIVPEMCVEMYNAQQQGNRSRALELHDKLNAFAKSLFVETSPGPVKHALKAMGLPGGDVREPLAPIKAASEKIVEADLRELGLI